MRRLVGLQWGRGIAALAVVLGHAMIYRLDLWSDLALYLGRMGVTLFFVISGFIMVMTTGIGGFDPRVFMLKRLLRIVPLYYFVTLLTAVVAFGAPNLFKGTVFDIGHIFSSLLFIPAFRPGTSEIVPFVKLGWTLNYEMFFYLCFAGLFFLTAVQRAIVLSVVFGMLMILGLAFDFSNPVLEFYTRLELLAFLSGMWVAVLAQRDIWQKIRISGDVVLAGTVVAALAFAFAYPFVRGTNIAQLMAVPICSLAVGCLALTMDRWTERGGRAMALLGDASYSIYLFHLFGIGVIGAISTRLLPLPPVLEVGLGTVAGVLVGTIGYYLVEKQLTKRFGYRSVRSPVPSHGGEARPVGR